MEFMQKFSLTLIITLIIIIELLELFDKKPKELGSAKVVAYGLLLGVFFVTLSLLFTWAKELPLINTLLLSTPERGISHSIIGGYLLIYVSISSFLKLLYNKHKTHNKAVKRDQ